MTSFELFRLIKLNTYLHFYMFFIFFLLKQIACDNMKKIKIFCIKLWFNNWYQDKIMQVKL